MRVHGSSTLISFFAYRFDDSVVAAAVAFPPPAIDRNQVAGGLVQFVGQCATGAHCAKENLELLAQEQREKVEIRGPWASPMHRLQLLDPSLSW
jgi:hypothetical protein